MSKCCKYHNKLDYIETDLEDCGMSGSGIRPVVCCPKCPVKRGKSDYYIDDIVLGLTNESGYKPSNEALSRIQNRKIEEELVLSRVKMKKYEQTHD